MVTFVRSIVKEVGERLPSCDADYFAKKMGPFLPSVQRDTLEPVLEVIAVMTDRIKSFDKKLSLSQR